MALPRTLRFRTRRDVRRVLSAGSRFALPLGRVAHRAAAGGRGRILFVVSRAVSKKSTERNRLRRQLGEAFVRALGRQELAADAVVLVAPRAAFIAEQEYVVLVRDLVRRLGGIPPHAARR